MDLPFVRIPLPMPRSRRRWRAMKLVWGGLGLLLAVGIAAAATASNDDCLACHGDKTMTTKRGGRTVSLFVDGKKFATSIHAAFSCTNCHADLEGKDLPHDA